MPFFTYKDIKIAGVAVAVPKQRVDVKEFNDRFGAEAVEKFSGKTGILEYRKTVEHQTASDLGFVAAEKILTDQNIDRSSIGALIFVTQSADYRRPATACVLHKRLGLSKECAAFDVTLGCSATAYGLQVACSMLANSDMERCLLIMAETVSKLVHPMDRAMTMMFGDAGAAMLLERSQAADPIHLLLRTDGSGYRSIIAPAGGFRNYETTKEAFVWPDGNTRTLYNSSMNGADVFAFGITDVPRTIKDFLLKTETTVDDYDCYAMHQANRHILTQIAKKIKIPLEKMPFSLDRYGNTSAASPSLTLCDAYAGKTGLKLRTLFCGFGVGLSWGVASATVDSDILFPIIETDEIFEEGIINEPI